VTRAALKDQFHAVQGVNSTCKPGHPAVREFAKDVAEALFTWHQPRVDELGRYLEDQWKGGLRKAWGGEKDTMAAMRSDEFADVRMKDYSGGGVGGAQAVITLNPQI
jgi:hypothetical protein